ncbi:MOSC domain-containing protein [Neorhizobium lilium]|uniref:MOSC domain-containing protein n=1 Tax=Neorhizobium lilium TaxID=2503024 RepID=A0A3S3TVQ6_9HYPH|nr:MOSC domain-containing protein [Neorhizobium lilium]RWX75933.1 MOSC domain-containing protein [Neorhizobium lilium]
MRVSEINVFPLKSGRGIALAEAEVAPEGLPGDRRMMLVDPSGHFVNQRDLQAMAQLQVHPEGDGFRFAMDGKGEIRVARPAAYRRIDVVVWKSIVSAALAERETNARLSEWLGREVQLVFFDEKAKRTAGEDWAGPDSPVTFADGYQVLVTTTGSLAAINADMARHGEGAVGMDRFRANIVIDDDQAFADDGWEAIEISGVRLDLVKPCSRCIMITQDQITGSREGANPMTALGRIRMSADRRVPGPLFGWNAVPRGTGRIRLGDEVRVLSKREGWAIKQRA